MTYVIGVDCGGTKTQAVAYDDAGNILEEVVTAFGNLVVDYTYARDNIQTAIETLLDRLGKAACRRIVLGIAGIDAGGLKSTITKDLEYLAIPTTVMNDGQLAQYAILKGANGAVIIAGTGSIFIGRQDDTWYRVGGWGHLFGDEGSAYGITRDAIVHALNDCDNNQKKTCLTQALFDFFEVEDIFGLTRQAYQLTKGEIAQAASMIAEMAQSSLEARQILVKAGEDLAKGVMQLAQKMPAKKEFQVGLNGSVIENNRIVRQAFDDYLATKSDIAWQIVTKESSCAKAAYYYDKGMN